MKLNASQILEQQIEKKLSSMTQTMVLNIFSEISIQKNKMVSKNFQNQFNINLKFQAKNRIEPLYVARLSQVLNANYSVQAQNYADHYQINQLKSLINQKLKLVFDRNFKQQYKQVLYDIAQTTLKNTEF